MMRKGGFIVLALLLFLAMSTGANASLSFTAVDGNEDGYVFLYLTNTSLPTGYSVSYVIDGTVLTFGNGTQGYNAEDGDTIAVTLNGGSSSPSVNLLGGESGFVIDWDSNGALGSASIGIAFPPDMVKASAVPIPSAVWLLGSGLLGLVGIRKVAL